MHEYNECIAEAEKIATNQELDYIEVDDDNIKVKMVKKILIPASKYPNVSFSFLTFDKLAINVALNLQFNFAGKIVGPGGKIARGLSNEYKVFIHVLG